MSLLRQLRATYNPWFMIPFLVWMIAGSVLFMLFQRNELFQAVNQRHTHFLDVFMWCITFVGDGLGSAIVLLSMMIFYKPCRSWWYVLAAIVCTVAPAILIQVIKHAVAADRPLQVFRDMPDFVHHLEYWDNPHHNSFPSGHSGSVFSMCSFLSMILPLRRAWVGLLLFVLALTVAYSRMYVAAHFYADIFVGSLLGTIGAILCLALLSRATGRSFRIEYAIPHRNNPPLS